MKKILLAAPLHQKVRYFLEFQKSLDSLLIPQGYSLDRFYVVNDCPEIIPYIREGAYIEMDGLGRQSVPHIWGASLIEKMIKLRNAYIQYAKELNYDYVFVVDTDLVLKPETLQVLLDTGHDIVSEGFWTKFPDDEKSIWYNGSQTILWEFDENNTTVNAIKHHMKPGLYPIGMTGACMLVSKAVLDAGVDYSDIPYLFEQSRSEDKNFCIRALVHGFQPYMDTHCPPVHLYDDKEYQKYMKSTYGG